jgi:hypothetical protein
MHHGAHDPPPDINLVHGWLGVNDEKAPPPPPPRTGAFDLPAASPRTGAFDLPAGQPRLKAEGVGVHGVWVNGVRVFGDGASNESLPGRLLREFDA